MFTVDTYEIIVVGAGHAGCEAALAAARMGCRTLLLTLNLDNIALMPCNPSAGGPAKGHLVMEIDALGGEMGVALDKACIQMRMLNTGKGPAVRALRTQTDKQRYHEIMKQTVENQENLTVKQLLVEDLYREDGRLAGVVTELGEIYRARCVILATGTYLRGKIIIGESAYAGGPNGQRSAEKLGPAMQNMGIRQMRFKTGTPARVDKRSLDFSKMTIQPGDEREYHFSALTKALPAEPIPCWLTYTCRETHTIIRANLHRAPLYTGQIEGTGTRYCPSIEDKVVRFADKEQHQLFIEPEGRHTNEMYVQGMSTSLPVDVQYAFLRTIPGLEQVQIMRPGYAIEYDVNDPFQLTPSLEFKDFPGLFSAGQCNGTSGYEEAAAQGLIAGINAVRKLRDQEPFVLTRDQGYMGVLVDDLVTKEITEPYRVMTSRAEYRLLLRQDNADLRLTQLGHDLGLVSEERYRLYCQKKQQLEASLELLRQTKISANEENQAKLEQIGSSPLRSGVSAYELLRRNELTYVLLAEKFGLPQLPVDLQDQVEIAVKYEGYIKKQAQQVEKAAKLEKKLLPPHMEYLSLKGIATEARQKLDIIRPRSIGQASRISGVSPADISVLLIHLEKQQKEQSDV